MTITDDGKTKRREKLDLVWASVALGALAFAGLQLLLNVSEGARLDLIAAAFLVVAEVFAMLNVTLLLSAPAQPAALLMAGRFLLWICFSVMMVAGGLGITSLLS